MFGIFIIARSHDIMDLNSLDMAKAFRVITAEWREDVKRNHHHCRREIYCFSLGIKKDRAKQEIGKNSEDSTWETMSTSSDVGRKLEALRHFFDI